jgi:hypothetical protein
MGLVMIRGASPAEMAEVGDIRIAAYRNGGFISADSGYAPTLRGLGADGNGEVLVATVARDSLAQVSNAVAGIRSTALASERHRSCCSSGRMRRGDHRAR